MSIYKPFDPDRPLFSSRCSCGMHASESEHQAAVAQKLDEEEVSANFIEASLVKALSILPRLAFKLLLAKAKLLSNLFA